MSYEKLDVYKTAVELRASVTRAIAKRGSRDLRDQFGRTSSSVILNLAEGADALAHYVAEHLEDAASDDHVLRRRARCMTSRP